MDNHAKTPNPPHSPDNLRLRRWFAFYGLFLLAAALPLAALIYSDPEPFRELGGALGRLFRTFRPSGVRTALAEMSVPVKLLIMILYMAVCTTFLPLPTGFMITVMSFNGAGVSSNLWITVPVVAFVGAAVTTIANLTDYHIFMWMLRNKRIAGIRHTRAGRAMSKWFGKSPFLIMVIFNIVHIPIDVPRMLAALYGYQRRLFAASNFVGRLSRYALYSSVTFLMGDLGWIMTAITLAIGTLLGLCKIVPALIRHRQTSAGHECPEDSGHGRD